MKLPLGAVFRDIKSLIKTENRLKSSLKSTDSIVQIFSPRIDTQFAHYKRIITLHKGGRFWEKGLLEGPPLSTLFFN